MLKNKRIKYTKRLKVKIPLRQRLQSIVKKLFYYNKNDFYTEIHLCCLCMKFKSNIVGRNLHFEKIPNQYLDGFYDAEPWGRWSCGRQSKISLQIPYTDDDLQIDFKLHVFALEKILNQHIDVYVNNKKIISWEFVNKKALPNTKLLIKWQNFFQKI